MWLPNALTLANLVSGILMIIWTLQGNSDWVVAAMGAALLFDFLDGFVARSLGAYHPLGAQLDSLADMVSFGVVPGILLYTLLHASGSAPLLLALCFVFPVCAAIRLARFNLDEREACHFFGLPSPSAAIFVFGLYVMAARSECTLCLHASPYWPIIAVVATLFVALLMLTELPHFSLKTTPGKKLPYAWLILLVMGIALLVVFLGWEAISSSVLLYILLSLIYFRNKQAQPG